MSVVTLSIPVGVDLDALVANYTRSDKRRSVAEACCFILNFLVNRPLSSVGRKEVVEYGGHPINIDYLRKAVGRNAVEALELLVSTHIIILVKNHSAGNHSRIYMLERPFRGQDVRTVTVETPTVIKTLNTQAEKARKQAEDPKIQHLVKFLQPGSIRVNMEAAHYYLETWSTLMTRGIMERFGKTKDKRKVAYKRRLLQGLNLRIENMKMQLRAIEKGNMSFSRSENNLRLHTPVVSLKSEMRNFLQYNGQELIDVDVSAAQPLLLRYILNPLFWKTPEKGRQLSLPLLHISTSYPELFSVLQSNTTLLNTIITYTSQAAESSGYVSYASLFEKGDFYENLMDLVKSHYSPLPEGFKSRKQVKATMMYFMFEDFQGKDKLYTLVYQVFKTIFPRETAVLDILKSVAPNAVALLLQRCEAIFMLDHVTKRIAEVEPDACLLTVHDAIVTTVEHEELVKEVLEREFYALSSIKPKLKVTPLSSALMNDRIEDTLEEDYEYLKWSISGKKYENLPKDTLYDDSPLLLPKVPIWNQKSASTLRVHRMMLQDPLVCSVLQAMSDGISLVNTNALTAPSSSSVVLPAVSERPEVTASTKSISLQPWEVIPVLGSPKTPTAE